MPCSFLECAAKFPGVDDAALDGCADLEKLAGEAQRISAKLDNANFVNKAPAGVVAQQRAKRGQILADAEKMKRLIAGLPEV
jgi:valyl-tRNA synthetase